jgi:hypothetical protein
MYANVPDCASGVPVETDALGQIVDKALILLRFIGAG